MNKIFFLVIGTLFVGIFSVSINDVSACHGECIPTDYEFGIDKKVDLEVLVCLNAWGGMN